MPVGPKRDGTRDSNTLSMVPLIQQPPPTRRSRGSHCSTSDSACRRDLSVSSQGRASGCEAQIPFWNMCGLLKQTPVSPAFLLGDFQRLVPEKPRGLLGASPAFAGEGKDPPEDMW